MLLETLLAYTVKVAMLHPFKYCGLMGALTIKKTMDDAEKEKKFEVVCKISEMKKYIV
ncbi:hypothetical protein [Paenibacillus cremeus]|uniref:hypothetical protein n=1 Tax=Paenibacillus cremeus TaxID=2163881 RepID=UPI001C943122|nr:hypothetical protein [Paenibacillus cremeus]